MYCPNCGDLIRDGASFCPDCGIKIEYYPEDDRSDLFDSPPEDEMEYDHPRGGFSGGSKEYYDPIPVKKGDTRWPPRIGVMGIFYFIFYLFWVVAEILGFYTLTEGNVLSIPAADIIGPLLVSLVPLVYFLHTKKLAFLTAIPMVAITVFEIVNALNSLNYMVPTYFGLRVFPAFFSIILVVLYIVQMIVRPYSSALSVIYLVISIIGRVITGIFISVVMVEAITATDNYSIVFAIGEIFYYIASVFAMVGYSMAMFSARKSEWVLPE